MRHAVLLGIAMGVSLSAFAGPEMACMQDCFSRGYDQSRCVTVCEARPGGYPAGGMLEQPGVPRNPAFDQIQSPPGAGRTPRVPLVADQKCLKDCQKRGYDYLLCQRQCSYSGYGGYGY